MNESSSIEEAARQPLFLCPVCLRKLRRALRFNILERLRALVLQCQELRQVVKDSTKAELVGHGYGEEEEQGTECQKTSIASRDASDVDQTSGTGSMIVDSTSEHLGYFGQAIEWLEDSIASLLQFSER